MSTPGIPDPILYNPPVPNPPFAVPEGEGTRDARDWSDTPDAHWAPNLTPVPGGTPDPMRTMLMPTRDYRPDPRRHSKEFYLGVNGPGRDEVQRHGVETWDTDGKTADVPIPRRFADDPYETTEPRPTNRMSPSTYTMTRPFDQRFARRLNGEHFSMADHRREYPIMGQQPPIRRRNTWRAEPAPWDANLVDMPNDAAGNPFRPGPIQAVEVPATRNFRLT